MLGFANYGGNFDLILNIWENFKGVQRIIVLCGNGVIVVQEK